MKKYSIIFTLIYIFFVIAYTISYCMQNENLVLLNSAELGSFLAGLFSPLAFLYLFLGFRQQESALIKTREDIAEQLRIQKEALDLQIEERKQYEFESLPLISIETHILEITKKMLGRDYIQTFLEVNLENLKKEAYYFNCDLIEPNAHNCISEQQFSSNDKKTFKIDLSTVLSQNNTDTEVLNFQYSFTSLIGIHYTQDFDISIDNDTKGGIIATYSEIGSPEKINQN